LQNGAKIFANYCLNCHAASYMRFNRLQDIGLTDKQIKENLNFISDKTGDLMQITMDPVEAKKWFGATPPDLSVIARSRAGSNGSGADYLYSFLRGYYRDPSKLTGWNNVVFPNVAMPNPLWELQGEREVVYKTVESHGQETRVFAGWKDAKAGTMDQREFNDNIGDLVAYLQWMGEPAQNTRVRIGVFVLFFLGIFTLIAWRLNAAFWKDIK
jgi:ubiquinol-cytochrome c reductase cytochrome c1 subunit